MSRFPWWGSILLAIIVYCGLKYGAASLLPEENRLIRLIQLFAPLAAMGFLLLAGKQLYDGDGEGEAAEEIDDSSSDEASGK